MYPQLGGVGLGLVEPHYRRGGAAAAVARTNAALVEDARDAADARAVQRVATLSQGVDERGGPPAHPAGVHPPDGAAVARSVRHRPQPHPYTIRVRAALPARALHAARAARPCAETKGIFQARTCDW
eukprot:3166228-Pyramimonas_sp.AAC.1